ncbi:universal stress protein [Erythrobacter sp. YT30]|uniref:universal stress protein n=1 Tax=Erythrobacter sp. YT30 TaxID=1735012 RepID=UPI000A6DD7E8|nr:universal stress protein [Erythrobacter sp. YT30]
MRSILLHVYDDKCFEARLQVALDIARQCKGRLTCAQAAPYDFGMPTDFYGAMSAEMMVEYTKTSKKFRAKVEKELSNEGVAWSWASSGGSAMNLIACHAPIHDLVIVGAHDPLQLKGSPSRFVGELLERVRAPILVVPEHVKSFDVDGPVTVAWNGAPESAHALRAALPLLSRSSSVQILTVEEKKKTKREEKFDLPSMQASEYLAQNDITSELIELPRKKGDSIAETLVTASKIREAGYLVMGAYGHSRFRERILGGVTRDMLREPQLPLFLSH